VKVERFLVPPVHFIKFGDVRFGDHRLMALPVHRKPCNQAAGAWDDAPFARFGS